MRIELFHWPPFRTGQTLVFARFFSAGERAIEEPGRTDRYQSPRFGVILIAQMFASRVRDVGFRIKQRRKGR
jgi:hypothetical protein